MMSDKMVSSAPKRLEMKTRPAIIIVLAFFCALFLAITKTFRTTAVLGSWPHIKTESATPCGPNADRSEKGNQWPEKNSGNGCAHTGVSFTFFIVGNKRNKTQTC